MIMIRPLFIDNDYQLLNSASGQIARNFWESQVELAPSIVCTPANFDFKSKWNTIEIEDRLWIRYFELAFKKVGMPGLAFMPDIRYYSWAKFVMRKLKNESFDYIHTLSSPASTHLIGLYLKKRTGKPWIAQFNDPWIDSSDRRKNHFPAFSCRVDSYYERKVVENADIIIHTNHILADIFQERYGDVVKDKMVVLPLNFNINPLPEITYNSKQNSQKICISHIGEVYSTRSTIDFLNGLAMLLDKYPHLKSKIEVCFVGGVKTEEYSIIKTLGLDDMIKTTKRMPPQELKKYYESSDVFLAIDVKLKKSPSFPSKLMMYHYYRKPILGITNPASIMEEELKKTGNYVCYYGHPEQVCDYLYNACVNYRAIETFDTDYWKNFTVENVTEKYMSIVSKIVQ